MPLDQDSPRTGEAEHDATVPAEEEELPTLGRGVSASGEPVLGDGPIGEALGPYRLLGELGRGGMGIVYLAAQTRPVERQVALKLIRSPFRNREAEIRFDAERQAMARLQHPNVAQIFEAGTTASGHPFFAMELVEGEPITAWCDRHRLSVGDRVRLFRDVCAGVHHAHQKGVLHRDLKPSNVLVSEIEGRPVVKVIDFGIAKATDRPLVDETLETGATVLGTPAYLPPEALQADGSDVDTRLDVYSLGILLYELLVGARPFDAPGDNLLRVLRRVTEEDPREPSARWKELDEQSRGTVAASRKHDVRSLPRRLRGDLDWIVLSAIARRREDRYESVDALAADLGRFLRKEPVSACPPSALYRARKFVQRRAGVVLATLLVVLSLGGGFVARTIEADRARTAALRALEAQREAEEALAAEERARLEAEEARLEAAELSEFLIDLFQVSDPGEATANTVTARELLDEGALRLEDRFARRPLVQARLLQTIGDVYRKLGLYPEAERLFRRALGTREEHLREDHPDLAESVNGLGVLLAQTGQLDAAEPLFRRALEIRERQPERNLPRLAASLNNLANLNADLGRFEEAERLYLRSIEIAESYEGPPHPDLFVALNNLASAYVDQGRLEDAEPLVRRFVDRQRAVHGERHPHVAIALGNLADLRVGRGELSEAEALYREALEILAEALGPDHPEVAYGRSQLAGVLAATGRTARAEELYLRALAVQREVFPPGHPERRSTERGLEELGRSSGTAERSAGGL